MFFWAGLSVLAGFAFLTGIIDFVRFWTVINSVSHMREFLLSFCKLQLNTSYTLFYVVH